MTLLLGGAFWSVALGAGSAPWARQGDDVRAGMSAPDVASRREASAHLSRMDPGVARDLTLVALRDSDSVVRIHALDAAARLHLSEARRFALQWLSDPDPQLRRAAARLIVDMAEASDVQTLGRTLSDADPTVRALAAEALGRTGSETAVPALLGQLDDQQPRVRVAITRALGRLRDRRSVSALMGRLHDPDGLVREAAAVALAEIGDRRAIGPIVLALSDTEPGGRAAAAAALGELGAASTVTELERLAASDMDPRVRAAALLAMGRLRSVASGQALLRALTVLPPASLAPSVGGGETEAVMRGFGAAGPTATKLLNECLSQASPRSALCARALASADPATAVVPISEALVAGQIPPSSALGLLESLASPESVPAVLQRLERDDSSASDRARAILVLDAIIQRHGPDGRIAQPVGAVLKRASSTTERAALIQLLGRAGNASVAEIVASFTSVRWPRSVRRAAYGALRDLHSVDSNATRAAIGEGRLDALLLVGLDDPDDEVRRAAALATANSGSAELVEPLLARYSVSMPGQRQLLASALRTPLGSGSPAQVQAAVRSLGAARGRLRDAWIESLAPTPRAASLLAAGSLDDADRAKLAEGLDQKDVQLLDRLAADGVARVRANAIWRIGAARSASRLTPLFVALDDADPAVSANAVAGIARVTAAAGEDMDGGRHEAAVGALCGALADPRSAVRQNALAGLLLVGATCPGATTERMLRRDPSQQVRLLAADLLSAASQDAHRASLLACARDDTSGEVRRACALFAERPSSRERVPPWQGSGSVLVDVVPASGDSAVGNAPFGLRFDNGLVRYGLTDRRGRVREPDAPRGRVTLSVPAAYRRD